MSQVGLGSGSNGVDGLGFSTLSIPYLEHRGSGGPSNLNDVFLLVVPVDLAPPGGRADGSGQLRDMLEARTLGKAEGRIWQVIVTGDEGSLQLDGIRLLGYASNQVVDLLGNSGHDYLAIMESAV